MKGLGTDFTTITREVVANQNLQRQMIREAYAKHGRVSNNDKDNDKNDNSNSNNNNVFPTTCKMALMDET